MIARLMLVLVLLYSGSAVAIGENEFDALRHSLRDLFSHSPLEAVTEVKAQLGAPEGQFSVDQQVQLLNYQAWFLAELDQLEEAIITLARMKELLSEASDPFLNYAYHNLTAYTFEKAGLYEQSLQSHQQALALARESDRPRFVHQSQNNIAGLYLELGRCAEAATLLQGYLTYLQTHPDPLSQSIALINMIRAAICQNQLQVARTLLIDAQAIQKKHQLKQYLLRTMKLQGELQMRSGELAKAQASFEEALQGFAGEELKDPMLETLFLLIELHLTKSELTQANNRLVQARPLLESLQSERLWLRYYQLQRHLAEVNGEYQQALAASDAVAVANKNVMARQNSINLAFVMAQIDLADREAQIVRMKGELALEEAEDRAFRIEVGIGAIAVLLLLSLSWWYIASIRRKKDKLTMALHELRETQRHLVESEKIAALSTLVVGLAHQLNTPLGSITTSVSCFDNQLDMLKTQFDAKKISIKQMQDFLHQSREICMVIQKSTGRVVEMVEKFKAISASMEKSEPEALQLKAFLGKKIPLIEDYSKVPILLQGEDVQVVTFPDTLLKVIYLLVENAMEHAFADTEAPQICIRLSQDDRWVYLEFRDNGCGVAKEHQSKIFTPFYTSKLGQGKLGLGLNVIYNSVFHILTGRIEHKGQEAGMVFEIRLPKHS
ncbi:hypothetical protein GCM10009092_09500 [Bowmanella denitrificans]|uniref:Histidine kinase domain-containing protein n=1 Tax=Bowmanella denitrificans TaxID=366582 RepID=A0ABP3GMV7_9ALTE